ncbi:glycosyltransferase [Shimia sp. SDUM112013]|uniref:glycosyltransferase family 2 protein n=1 Tax=Shimia sp. SDUM112013 TaxID=3136160 RepID=UPI0032F04889
MTQLPVSVVIVSRGRPDALTRCLTGVSQLFYDTFEIVVVADQAGCFTVRAHEIGDRVKLVEFDEANISAARNLGIAEAAGDIVAFLDDDAVPEPTWLDHLVAPFAQEPELVATTGFVRGRNGISYQWRARCVDQTGKATDLMITGKEPVVLRPQLGRTLKTEGTNMAFRRTVLAEIGGFDPAFRYYLDETDVDLRLARLNHPVAVVPLAEVHHGFYANGVRRSNRAPKDLFEIGASMAVFLRKHCPEQEHSHIWQHEQASQKKRLVGFMVSGQLEPGEVVSLMKRLRQGYAEGLDRMIDVLPPIPRATTGMRTFERHENAEPVVLAGRIWQRKKLRQKAADLSAKGHRVSLFVFSPTAYFHRVSFEKAGFWEQSGGLFGKSERTQPWFRLTAFRHRVREEKQRVAVQRGLNHE